MFFNKISLTLCSNRSVDKFTFASNADDYGHLKFDVTVSNYGEDAFEAMFFMSFPDGWEYVTVQSTNTDFFVACVFKWSYLERLMCDIGNPLSAGKSVGFRFEINLVRFMKCVDVSGNIQRLYCAPLSSD